MLKAIGKTDCKRLAANLKRGTFKNGSFPSMASAVWMRMFRQKLIGAVLEKLVPFENSELNFVTLINKKWIIPRGKLCRCDPKKIIEEFRQHLYRSGTTNASGVLFAWLHGEYDPFARCYRLHIHCICSMAKASALRSIQEGKFWGYEVAHDVMKPIVFRSIKAGMGERERVVSYTFQQFWPERTRFFSSTGKLWKLHDRRRMVPAAEHEVLLWLSHQRPSDLMLCQPNIRKKIIRNDENAVRNGV